MLSDHSSPTTGNVRQPGRSEDSIPYEMPGDRPSSAMVKLNSYTHTQHHLTLGQSYTESQLWFFQE